MSMFNARDVAQDFSSAAIEYDDYAHVQQQVLIGLIKELLPILPTHTKILDAGCGTGQLARNLKDYSVTQIDLAYAMCMKAAPHGIATINGTIESLPFANNSFDAVVCSLALQWIENPQQAIGEMQRVLKSGGTLAISTFGPGTLQELKESFAVIDDYEHTSPFSVPAGFGVQHTVTEYYPRVVDLMHNLKKIGARNKLSSRRKSMMTRKQLEQVEYFYKEHFATDEGLRVTWDIRTMIVTKP